MLEDGIKESAFEYIVMGTKGALMFTFSISDRCSSDTIGPKSAGSATVSSEDTLLFA